MTTLQLEYWKLFLDLFVSLCLCICIRVCVQSIMLKYLCVKFQTINLIYSNIWWFQNGRYLDFILLLFKQFPFYFLLCSQNDLWVFYGAMSLTNKNSCCVFKSFEIYLRIKWLIVYLWGIKSKILTIFSNNFSVRWFFFK